MQTTMTGLFKNTNLPCFSFTGSDGEFQSVAVIKLEKMSESTGLLFNLVV